MLVLALDTSTLVMGVALLDESRIWGEVLTNQKKNHSVRLMPAIQSLMKALEIEPGDLDAVVVTQGPGSYTGVRIGVTTAKTMAWTLNIPLVGVSTLAVMAASTGRTEGFVNPLIDARRGRVYTGLYALSENGPSLVEKERVVALSQWLEETVLPLTEEVLRPGDVVYFTGEGLAQHEENILTHLGTQWVYLVHPYAQLPRPEELGRLGLLVLAQERGSEGQRAKEQKLEAQQEEPWKGHRESGQLFYAERAGADGAGLEGMGLVWQQGKRRPGSFPAECVTGGHIHAFTPRYLQPTLAEKRAVKKGAL